MRLALTTPVKSNFLYISSRAAGAYGEYTKNYTINIGELNYLSERVCILGKMAKEICEEKINRLKAMTS
jgi:hypothetical protein